MQAAEFSLNPANFGKKTLWSVIDAQLDHLRSKSARERYAYVHFLRYLIYVL